MSQKKSSLSAQSYTSGTAPSSPYVDLENATRTPEEIAVYKKVFDSGESPFLLKNLRKFHSLPILKEGDFWYITPNQWPYHHTKFHFLIIAKEFWTRLDQITPQASQELMAFATWLQQEYQIEGGAVCLRFGDPNLSAGSVTHLHAQFIVPDRTAPDFQPVRFKIGKERSGQEIKN